MGTLINWIDNLDEAATKELLNLEEESEAYDKVCDLIDDLNEARSAYENLREKVKDIKDALDEVIR